MTKQHVGHLYHGRHMDAAAQQKQEISLLMCVRMGDCESCSVYDFIPCLDQMNVSHSQVLVVVNKG